MFIYLLVCLFYYVCITYYVFYFVFIMYELLLSYWVEIYLGKYLHKLNALASERDP